VVFHDKHTNITVTHRRYDFTERFDFMFSQSAGRFVKQEKMGLHYQAAGDLKETLLRVLKKMCPPINDLTQSHAV